MNTNSYVVRTFVTTITGKTYVSEDVAYCATFETAKAAITNRINGRNRWDDDGFNRKVEYVVRYGSKRNGWDAREFVVTTEFSEGDRKFYAYAPARLVDVLV